MIFLFPRWDMLVPWRVFRNKARTVLPKHSIKKVHLPTCTIKKQPKGRSVNIAIQNQCFGDSFMNFVLCFFQSLSSLSGFPSVKWQLGYRQLSWSWVPTTAAWKLRGKKLAHLRKISSNLIQSYPIQSKPIQSNHHHSHHHHHHDQTTEIFRDIPQSSKILQPGAKVLCNTIPK